MTRKCFNFCCEKCFSGVAKQSTGAAKLWLDLCEYAINLKRNFVKIEEPKNVHLEFYLKLIEHEGLIVSIDTNEAVIIKLNSFDEIFCKKREYHD